MAFEIEIFIDALKFNNGILVGIAMWQLVIKMAMSFFNERLKLWMEQALPTEQVKLNKFLNSFGYRFTVFIFHSFLSVKLPTTAKKTSGDTTITTKTKIDESKTDPISNSGK